MNNGCIEFNQCNNRYGLQMENLEKLIAIVNRFYIISKNINIKTLSFNEKISLLGFYGEIYNVISDKEECIERFYEVIGEIRDYIEETHFNRISLFGGLSNIALFIDPIVKETGYFQKFQDSLNQIIIEEADKQAMLYKTNLEWTYSSNYDVISGLYGVGAYLMTLDSDSAKASVIDIIDYFVKLSNYRQINTNRIPGWYIKNECLPTQEYKENYKSGCINYSLSHGIAGPLCILGKGLLYGMEVEGQREAIETILNEYKKTMIYDNQIAIWPGMIRLEDYINSIFDGSNKRMSWCYGSIGILKSLQVAATAMKKSKLEEWIYEQNVKIAEMPIEKFYLESPILCHGYAGASAYYRKMYDESHGSMFSHKYNEIVQLLLEKYDRKFIYCFKDFVRKYIKNGVEEEYLDKLTFLEGTPGICMELVAFLKEKSYFERILLLD